MGHAILVTHAYFGRFHVSHFRLFVKLADFCYKVRMSHSGLTNKQVDQLYAARFNNDNQSSSSAFSFARYFEPTPECVTESAEEVEQQQLIPTDHDTQQTTTTIQLEETVVDLDESSRSSFTAFTRYPSLDFDCSTDPGSEGVTIHWENVPLTNLITTENHDQHHQVPISTTTTSAEEEPEPAAVRTPSPSDLLSQHSMRGK